jgi:hypothetical protein
VIIIFNGQIFCESKLFKSENNKSSARFAPNSAPQKSFYLDQQKKIQTVSFYRTVLSIPFEEFLLLFYFGIG